MLQPDDEGQATILIIDDEPTNVMVLKSGLGLHYRVLTAHSGDEGIRIAEQEAPDLILLDVDMPHMNGFETCTRLKSNPVTNSVPVIFITGRGRTEDEVKGLESGAVDYITRPFEWSIVRSRVKTQVQLKRKTDILEYYVNIDGLTSIANRRRFDQFLQHEWNRALRNGHPLSLVMMDVDFFKRYNDRYGHTAGDDCLICVARALQHVMKRAVDLVARYGGEEFAAILPETPAEGACKVAERIRQAVMDIGIPHMDNEAAAQVTLSLGVATMVPQRELEPGDLIRAADQALYAAKKAGRNRVVCPALDGD